METTTVLRHLAAAAMVQVDLEVTAYGATRVFRTVPPTQTAIRQETVLSAGGGSAVLGAARHAPTTNTVELLDVMSASPDSVSCGHAAIDVPPTATASGARAPRATQADAKPDAVPSVRSMRTVLGRVLFAEAMEPVYRSSGGDVV